MYVVVNAFYKKMLSMELKKELPSHSYLYIVSGTGITPLLSLPLKPVIFAYKSLELSTLLSNRNCSNSVLLVTRKCEHSSFLISGQMKLGMHRIPYFRIRPDPDPDPDPVHL